MDTHNTLVEGFALSPQQRRLWSLQDLSGSLPYTTHATVRIRGRLDRAALRSALTQVVARHEILRTTFFSAAAMSVPVQVIVPPGTPPGYEDIAADPRSDPRDSAWRADPFDFVAGPLVRARLARRSDDEHVLLIAAPSICVDARSLQVLVSELARIYAGTADDSPEPLQYADAAAWLNDSLAAAETTAGRQFWEQQDLAAVLDQELPFARIEAAPLRIDTVAIPIQELKVLEALARRLQTGPDVIVAAAWQGVLQRITGASRLAIGYMWDGRNHAELNRAIGAYMRCLPLTGDVPDDGAFTDVVRLLERAIQAGRAWGDAFDLLRSADSPPATGAVPAARFVFEPRMWWDTCRAGDLELVVEECVSWSDRCGVRLVVDGGSQRPMTARFEFDAGRYGRQDMTRLAAQLANLLSDSVQRPGAPVMQLELLPADQEREIASILEGAVDDAQSASCMHWLFEAAAEAAPSATAVVCGDERLEYRDLNARANRLARHLRAQGAARDLPVAIFLERSVDLIAALLAVMKAGGAYLPLDTRWPPARSAAVLEDSGARLVITTAASADRVPPGMEPVLLDAHAAAIGSQPTANLPDRSGPDDLAYVLFTSGSTGRPKGVAVEHRQLTAYVRGVEMRLELPPAATYATVTTIAADLGNTAIFPALAGGGCVHLISEATATDPDALAGYLEHHRIDVLKIVPSHLRALLGASRPERLLPHKRLILGGEACPWDLVEDVRRLAPGCVVFNHYGPTETTVGATAYRVSSRDAAPQSATVPIGLPLPAATAVVLDTNGRRTPFWVPGELYIGGAGVARGYLHGDAPAAARFVTNPATGHGRVYRTGDRVRMLPDGNLEFLGRLDDQVKIRGFRIELAEIEAVLRGHREVSGVAVLCTETRGGGKQLAAFVAKRDGAPRPDAAALADFLRQQLPEPMVPSSVIVVDQIPLTANGKPDRAALLARLVAADAPAADGSLTAWESVIAAIWSDLLGVDRIRTDDNFYDLGGHSLLAIQAVTALEKHSGIQVSPRDLVFHTMRQFAALCEARKPSPGIG